MLSIITDFGCRRQCPYCIARQVGFDNSNILRGSTHFYEASWWIDALFNNLPNSGKFSISGGGDPLENPVGNAEFWSLINGICKVKNLSYDVHTSYEEVFDEKIRNTYLKYMDRAVFHLDPMRPIPWNIIRGKHRLVAVVDKTLSRPWCDELEKFASDQVSYRDLVAVGGPKSDYSLFDHSSIETAKDRWNNLRGYCDPNFDYWLRHVGERLPGRGKFIDQGDYNTYLWPNGQIRDKFIDEVERDWTNG
jgi:hypothetical protein